MSEKRETLKHTKLLAACAAALALAFACLAAAGCAKADEPGEASALVRVDAPGWEAQTSSPVILIVSEAGLDDPSFARAVAANADEEIQLASGDYEVEVIAPVNADGSTYEAIDVLELCVPAEEGSYALNVTLALVPAGDVSAERMADVLGGIARAAAVGDETLAGEAGRSVVGLAKKNASAGEAMSAEDVEKLAEAAEGAVAEEPAGDEGKAASTAAKPSASDPAQQSPSNDAASAPKPSTPSHEHSWTAVTSQKWVVDQAAWDEDVFEDSVVCSCGKAWSSTHAWSDHCEESLLTGGSGCSYSVKTTYIKTIHHDEVGHYETVTTGYRCSCGAVK